MYTVATRYSFQGNNTRWVSKDTCVEDSSEAIRFLYCGSENYPKAPPARNIKQVITEDVVLVGFLLIAGLSFTILGVVQADVYYASLGLLGILAGLFHYLGK
ncbi:MAG TPA: hypothetical protein ACFYED_04890 [Candidatus Tripitaka californicus]|uniref:hypothetical protein n=1 Tax=Candidatus Tripitaka californicus TaxID=3367616 RepID=UPI004029153E|nr:hypothetical protein [Planctomycetota bacterium]